MASTSSARVVFEVVVEDIKYLVRRENSRIQFLHDLGHLVENLICFAHFLQHLERLQRRHFESKGLSITSGIA
jgi:hypothetical protein